MSDHEAGMVDLTEVCLGWAKLMGVIRFGQGAVEVAVKTTVGKTA